MACPAIQNSMGKGNLDQKNKSKPITQEKVTGHSTKLRQGDPAEEPCKRTFNVMANVLTAPTQEFLETYHRLVASPQRETPSCRDPA